MKAAAIGLLLVVVAGLAYVFFIRKKPGQVPITANPPAGSKIDHLIQNASQAVSVAERIKGSFFSGKTRMT